MYVLVFKNKYIYLHRTNITEYENKCSNEKTFYEQSSGVSKV